MVLNYKLDNEYMTKLDLNKFPIIEQFHSLLWYNPFKEFPRLGNLGDISERIYGCMQFIGTKSDESYPYFAEHASVRAFLNDFSSLNEILKDHTQLELRNIAIEKTNYPLFHFLKLLRNVNFHVKSISGGTSSHQVSIYNTTTNKISDEITLTRYFITNCNLALLGNARDIKHYFKSEMQQTYRLDR